MKKILTIAALTLLIVGGCNKNNEKEESDEMTPRPASTQTWTFGDQIWSDVIQVPACDKSDFMESVTSPDCRSYTSGSTTWYYYNWPYVIANQDKMCPAPWRVPSSVDFQHLAGNPSSQTLPTAWGLPGLIVGSEIRLVGSDAYLWSTTGDADKYAISIAYGIYEGKMQGPPQVGWDPAAYGEVVRCVR
jgi:hypothetical protein